MSRPPMLVLADDLTGAAEMAGIGFAHGLSTALVLDPTAPAPDAELVVYDTNTRLDDPDVAAGKVEALLKAQPETLRSVVFKKVDSVMRGPLASETATMARVLKRKSVVLCPCNPSKGRIISKGRYSIDGTPLHLTGFAQDPHHPARSDSVIDLLGFTQGRCRSLSSGEPIPPDGGIMVCDATRLEEVAGWAAKLSPEHLPAGGADFFSALLATRGLHPSPSPVPTPAAPHLLLSGSLSPTSIQAREKARADGLACSPLTRAMLTGAELLPDELERWARQSSVLLSRDGALLVCTEGSLGDGRQTAAFIRSAFAALARALVDTQAFAHLLAEGGDIAAGAAEALGWKQFHVVGNWSPGVVCLKPIVSDKIFFTLKPGSYVWPQEIWSLFPRL